jgi:hypothetical protein
MSTSAPSDATEDAVNSLLQVMIEIKDTLQEIASAVQTLSTTGSG